MNFGSREQWEAKMPYDYGESNCILCSPEKTPILREGKYFYICRNKFPYLGLQDHLMAIPYRHVTLTSKMTKQEFGDLKEVEKFVKGYYKDQNYFSFVRETKGGKSLNHVHYHFLPGILYSSALEKMLEQQGF